MKRFIFASLFSCSIAFASVEHDAFLKLDDEQKMVFLETTNEYSDDQSVTNFLKNNPILTDQFTLAGKEVANVWGDTILEGPYSTEGNVIRVVPTSFYVKLGETYAMSGYAEQNAVFTESKNCVRDEVANKWGKECERGVIRETFYIDYAGSFIESENYPDFE